MSNTPAKASGKSVSVLAAFGLSVGTAIGWGSFVVTGSDYIGKAGPLGSAIGLLIGMVLMGVLCFSYHYMMNKFPNSGGIYSYIKHVFGHDHAFLASWFLILTYLAILWANATSFSLFLRFLLPGVFQFGFSYSIGGYDVYLGEILISIAFLLLVGGATLLKRKVVATTVGGLSCLFLVLIAVVFIVAMAKRENGIFGFNPQFVPEGNPGTQIIGIVAMSPWAYIGFESISNNASNFSFKTKSVLKVLLISVIAVTLGYIMMCYISAAFYPSEFSTWYEYVVASPEMPGLSHFAPFYVAQYVMGDFGVALFIIALLAVIITSVIGNIYGLSNLVKAMADDGVFPKVFAKEDKEGKPLGATLIILGVSLLVAFIGRVAIGWIVDVNTIGGVIVYGYVAISAMILAKKNKDKLYFVMGILGTVIALAFGLYTLIPNIFFESTLAKESFFIFVIWAIIGFFYFRVLLKRDKVHIYGRSMIVWVGLMILTIFASIIWTADMIEDSSAAATQTILSAQENGTLTPDIIRSASQASTKTNIFAVTMLVIVTTITQVILFSVFKLMKERAVESQKEADLANELATKDAMTGVKNKHAYVAKQSLIDQAIERGDAIEFAIAVCDINDLKYVNDNFGHEYGDAFIKEACSCICEIFSHSPVYRVGGDEFVVVLEGSDYENRNELMEKILNKSSQCNAVGGIVISVGLATFDPEEDRAFLRVFRRADQEMYEQKLKFKNTQAMKPIIAKL